MEQRKRGQFQEGFMLLIGLVLFALIGYSLLPTVANAQVASHGNNGTLVSNLSYAGQAINSLGPMIFAVLILLSIVTAGMSLFALFSR
jgi:ABC-type multidrug transport system fused ATPase/permease subunit